MRSRNLAVWGVAALFAITGMIVGCSKNSSGPTNPITNPEFNYMAAQSNEVVDSLVGLTDLALDMTVAVTDEVLNDLAFGPMPTDSFSVQDAWHIYLLTNSASGVTSSYIDSVVFLLNGEPQVRPEGANEMYYIRNWSGTSDDTTVSYKNTEVRTFLNAINTDDAAATLTGSAQIAILDVDKSGGEVVVRELTMNGTIADYNVDRTNGWNSGCPTSGTITVEATLSVTVGAAAPTVSEWTFEVTFENGRTIVVASEGGQQFSYRIQTCQE
jgi:hypothetical protein